MLLLLLLGLTTGALAAGTITDLRTDCLVSANGSCQVTKTVTIDFSGVQQSLTIPLGVNPKRASVAGYHAKKTVEDGNRPPRSFLQNLPATILDKLAAFPKTKRISLKQKEF